LDTTESPGDGEYSLRCVSGRLNLDEIRANAGVNAADNSGKREKSLKSTIIERAIHTAGSGHGKRDGQAAK
jgi:hypothetical protein